MGFFAAYPYALLSLALAVFSGAVLAISPRPQRRLMLLSGLLSTPWGLSSMAFVPEYWQPVRVLPYFVGPEDLVFSFANGVLVWAVAYWPFDSCRVSSISTLIIVRRLLSCWIGGCLSYFILRGMDWPPMTCTLASMAILAVALLHLRPDLAQIGIRGMVGFGIYYFAVLKCVCVLAPWFLLQWSASSLSSRNIWGLPMEEILWAAGFGAVWPAKIAFVFHCKPFARRSCVSRDCLG